MKQRRVILTAVVLTDDAVTEFADRPPAEGGFLEKPLAAQDSEVYLARGEGRVRLSLAHELLHGTEEQIVAEVAQKLRHVLRVADDDLPPGVVALSLPLGTRRMTAFVARS